MHKKILTLITSTLLCFTLINPVEIKAAEVTDAVETTESLNECTGNRDEIRRKNEELYQKWNALNEKQKADVYKSVKATVDAQAKFLDKLMKYDLLSKEDAQMIKDDMYARFEEMKANDALFQGRPKAESKEKKGTTDQNRGNTTTPANPVTPSNPGTSTNPVTPSNPGTSTNPATSTNPGTSTNPVTPTNPANTAKPAKPSDTNRTGN